MLTPTGVTFAQYVAAIRAGNLTHCRITFPVQNVVFEDADIEQSNGVVLTQYFNPDTNLTFGKAVSSTVQMTLMRGAKTEDMDWSEEFTLEFGVEIGLSTYWVLLGYFTTSDPNSYQNDTVTVTASDRMSKLDIDAEDFLSGLTFPMTIRELYHEICTYVGLTYANGDEISEIVDRQIPDSYVGASSTLRDLLTIIAEATGCYAKITVDGEITLKWFSDHINDYTILGTDTFSITNSSVAWKLGKRWRDLARMTWDQVSAYKWGQFVGDETLFTISGMRLIQSENDTGINFPINVNDKQVYLIVDNPYLVGSTTLETRSFLRTLYYRATGNNSYIPATVDCIGNWLIEAGDVVRLTIDEDTTIDYPIFNRTLKWNGACGDLYETTGETERNVTSGETRQKMVNGGMIHEYVRMIDRTYERIQDQFGNYYTKEETATEVEIMVGTYGYSKVSGITINADGVTMTGSKYISLAAGGYVKVGNWEFHQYGTAYVSNSYIFELGQHNGDYVVNSGIYWMQNNGGGAIQFSPTYGYNKTAGTLIMEAIYDSNYIDGDGETWSGSNSVMGALRPPANAEGYIGTPDYLFKYLFVETAFYYFQAMPSSRDVKDNIKPLESFGGLIDQLNPVSFKYKHDKLGRKRYGLIYEETQEVMPELCITGAGTKGINYQDLIPVLLKEIQELRKRVKDLENRQKDFSPLV